MTLDILRTAGQPLSTHECAEAFAARHGLVRGESVPRVNYVPFELVTPANMAAYASSN